MHPWPEPGARKEEEAMKKLFALLMALTMTVQLVTPAWADAVEDGPEESTEAVEVVEETTEATEETEEVPEETEAETEETEATEEVTEPEETTEVPTEETAEPTEIGEEAEDEQVAAVAALIEALPSVEELEGMTKEEQLAAYEQIQGAFDAYDALTDEQKTQIYGAEELFELLEYYDSQISVEASFCGTGTEGSPYLISTEEELRQLAQDVENGSTYVNECFQLENDIDLTEEWIPIGTEQVVFRGSFDGNGHTISNLSGTGEHLGLFAYVGGGAQITNVNVADVRFEKGPFLAGIAAEVDTSEGDVLIQNCHVLSGSIKGIDDEDTVVKCLAGIVGNSSGDNKLRITDCSNSAQILAGSDSYTSGGIAGNVVDATITRCANYGYVAGESDSGGICGNAIHSSFIACVNYAKVTTYYGAGISDGNNNIFSNCLNVGMINNDSDGRGYPIGKLSAGNTYENCYYLKGCFRTYKFPQDSTQTGKEVTEEQLASGEAAYGLGQYFGQTLGEDTFPVFRTESNQVYKVSVCGAIEKTFFVNMNQTVLLPSDPEVSYYLDDDLFDADTPITEDTELVAVRADHVLVKTEAVAPTNTTTGNNEYYTCSICGKVFKDALGTIETTVEAEILPKLAGESGNLTWVWTEDGVLTISGSGKMEDYSSDAKAPWGKYQSQITEVVLEAGVTSIGAYAFCGYSNLIGLTIPESITSIGESAFYGCSNLTGVTVPEGITSIGSGAFRDCSSLNSVIIPEGVVSIGDSAFRGCKNLTNVTIPEGITGIGSETFYDCSGLTSVIIPEGVTDIGDYAFYNCSSLSNVTIPEGVISIGEFAFGRCSKLTSVIIPEGTTSIGNDAFYGCGGLTSVIIPEGMTSIGESAFNGCSSLTSVKLPESLTSINSYTFSYCYSLTSVTIPENVTYISGDAFKYCSKLASILVNDGNTNYDSVDGVLFNKTHTQLVIYPAGRGTDYQIPAGVTSIGYNAFGGCGELTSVVIPDTVVEMGGRAFDMCLNLTNVVIPEKITSIGYEAFCFCSNLVSVAIPEGMTSVGYNAFTACSKLKDIYYGGSESQWNAIKFEEGNYGVTVATIHYNVKHVHDLQYISAKAATCTQSGNAAYYVCATCGAAFKDQAGTQATTGTAETIPALGHTMAIVNTIAPTCTEKGNRLYYTCKICGKSFKDKAGLEATTVAAETVPALGHTMTKTEAVAPTCTKKGTNAYYTCETCEKVFKDALGRQETAVEAEVLEALGHAMVLTEAKASTCTESGNNLYYTCKTCGKVYEDEAGQEETNVKAETIPALGHTMTKTEAVAPTCTESGNNAYYTCKTCREVFKDEMGREETTVQDETLAALGHTMTKTEAVAPTCTEKGNNAYYTCATCHKVFKDEAGKRLTTVSAETLAAFGHSMVKTAAKEATCTETGNNLYYTCATCGKVYKDEAGQEETTVKAETIPALGHTMVKTEAVDPTCTEKGNNAYYTCETCHKVYKDETGKQETTEAAEFLPALGHDMDKTEAVAPTHTSGGSNAYYTCKTCHKVFADAQGTLETTPEQERLPRLPGMADGKCGSLTWFISDEGKLTISGKGRMPDYSGSALAPWYDYREKILALEVEEGVLSMGDYAFFDCENLKTIQLPKSLTKLGKRCFVGCDSLALLDLTQLPKELTQKVTDLTGLAVLPETLSKLAGSKASFQWRLETIEGQPAAKNLAKLDGSQLTVLRSGTFRLVCLEEYTGLEASIQAAAQTTTVIRPEEREQLTSGEKLELSAWAMPFETELTADWTVTEESQAYATVTKDGVLTAKSITKPVQVTVRAVPKNGEDPAEKSIWLLPKTIGMGILVNGHLVGDSLTTELTEAELNLIAQIQPQGAKTEVTWTSSREDVAEISAAGTVKLLKPGITLIRAQSTDGSGVSAELTLKVQYLDGAEKLTLTADAAVLELGRTAQLTLSGEDTIDPEHVEFQITQGSAAAVDAQGLLTAGNVPGKVTIVAALKDDPLQRRAQLTVEIVPVLIRALTLEPQVSQSWGYALKEAGETNVYGEIAFVVNQNRIFQINAQGKDYREQWFGVTNLTYESSDPAVAQVDAKGLVTLTAKEAGECVITVRCRDSLGTETRLHIVLRDSAPRLDSTKLTLNSNLIAGVTTGLAESYNNTIQSVTLYDYDKTTKRYEEAPSDSFAAEAEDGTLTVRALGAQSSGTYQLKLVVTCLGGSYDYTLQVKVANSLPKVTVKQIGKFDTFYLDSTARLTATASGYEVERMELIGGDTFRMDEDGNLFYAESYNPGDKIVTKGTLLVYVEGYQVPVEKNVTVATTKTAPKLTLNPSASAVNRALEDPEFRVKVLWKGNVLDLTDAEVKADVGFATVEAQGQYLVFRLTGATGGTAKLSLRLPGWAQAVSLTHKITVDTKLPTVKLGTPTLKLNSLFSAQTARTSVWLTQGNLDISTMDFKAAREEGKCIDLSFDPETDSIEAKFNPEIPKPKAGTYSYTYTAYLENGTALPNGTIKVTVAATAPKVKLSAASVKLNRYLAGQEKAAVKVTLTGGTGYQVTDFEGLPDYMRYDAETSELTVVLPDENFTGEICNLYPVVREEESGQEVQLSTKLTLKVQTLNTNKLTVSLSAKGKLNTVDPDSAIAYTVTKVNNCLGTVEGVDLAGQDGDLFQADLDTSGVKPLVLLRLLPGESYATNKTYKVRFRFTVCGEEVLSSVLSVKVTQTALKVTAPKTAVYYLSQSGPLRCSLKANLPLESVALSTRTAKEFQQALGGQENLRLTGNRVEFKLTNPGALTAGKSYSVQLEFTPENAAENTKPTTIKLTVKAMK